MSDSGLPTYIYKLVPSSELLPDVLPERLPVSKIDQESGFIHLSTATQVPRTLKYFFADDPYVYVLRLRYVRVEKNIRWEDPEAKVCGERGGEGMFPHLYNDLKLGRDEVESRHTLEKDVGGWDEATKNATWLVY